MGSGARRQRFGKFMQDKDLSRPALDLHHSRVIEHLRLGIVIAFLPQRKRRNTNEKSVSIISVSMSLLTASLIPSGRVYADDNPPGQSQTA